MHGQTPSLCTPGVPVQGTGARPRQTGRRSPLRALVLPGIVAGLCAGSAAAGAEELVVQLPDPGFTVTIPGLPQISLGPHPAAAQNPSARLLGSSADGVNVSALAPKAEGASAQQCASWLTGSTISRYAPDLAAVQMFPAGNNAWVLLYPFKAGPVEQLKAHVFSGNNRGQCLEIHISRMGATPEQRLAWFAGFRGITVTAQ